MIFSKKNLQIYPVCIWQWLPLHKVCPSPSYCVRKAELLGCFFLLLFCAALFSSSAFTHTHRSNSVVGRDLHRFTGEASPRVHFVKQHPRITSAHSCCLWNAKLNRQKQRLTLSVLERRVKLGFVLWYLRWESHQMLAQFQLTARKVCKTCFSSVSIYTNMKRNQPPFSDLSDTMVLCEPEHWALINNFDLSTTQAATVGINNFDLHTAASRDKMVDRSCPVSP